MTAIGHFEEDQPANFMDSIVAPIIFQGFTKNRLKTFSVILLMDKHTKGWMEAITLPPWWS